MNFWIVWDLWDRLGSVGIVWDLLESFEIVLGFKRMVKIF